MAGCSGGSAISVTSGSVAWSSGVLLSVMRASSDHLDGRVASGDGNGNVGEDNDRRTQHPVHGRDFTWGHPVSAARHAVSSRSPPCARDPCLLPRRSVARVPPSGSPPGARSRRFLPRHSVARSSLPRSSIRKRRRALWLAGMLPRSSVRGQGRALWLAGETFPLAAAGGLSCLRGRGLEFCLWRGSS